jgi:hypothetical protein
MLSAPIRLLTRASAAAGARSAAPVSEVWAVLAHPGRWPEFDPFLASVTPVPALTAVEAHTGNAGTSANTVGDGGLHADSDDEVEVGQQFRALVRMSVLELPIVVDHVVPRSSLVITARLLPGLAEEVEHLVIPSASGGSQVTVRITLQGPLALPALIPRWLLRTLTVRLLARAAESELRSGDRRVSSVA